ncbi:hypothetical protein J4710_03350 [Staphylococcus xylosus]|uniref:Uncharacterized protein n=1 Tax=Staphylococcus xylosus TaxID=1288 RepID=A0A939NHP1_STAXY|nr:hypothetical protein [Staphylococcus xylosus]
MKQQKNLKQKKQIQVMYLLSETPSTDINKTETTVDENNSEEDEEM